MEGVRLLPRLCWVPSPLDDLDDLEEKIEGDIFLLDWRAPRRGWQGEGESRNYPWIRNVFCLCKIRRSCVCVGGYLGTVFSKCEMQSVMQMQIRC